MVHNTIILIMCLIQSMFSIMSITMHCIGIFLLKDSSYAHTQKIYLVQLSILEILFMLVNNNVLLYVQITNVMDSDIVYLPLFILTLIAVPWCITLILLTIDRFAQIWCNIKYKMYVTKRKTSIAVVLTWTIGIAHSITLFILQYLLEINAYLILHKYIIQVFMALVVLVSIPTYSYIYRKLQNNKKKSRHVHIRKKATFVPFWIMFSFCCFFVLPNVIQLLTYRRKVQTTLYFYIGAMMVFDAGCMVDVFIYIIMNPSVRRKFLLIMRWAKIQTDSLEPEAINRLVALKREKMELHAMKLDSQ